MLLANTTPFPLLRELYSGRPNHPHQPLNALTTHTDVQLFYTCHASFQNAASIVDGEVYQSVRFSLNIYLRMLSDAHVIC